MFTRPPPTDPPSPNASAVPPPGCSPAPPPPPPALGPPLTSTPSASSHSACLLVDATFPLGEIKPEEATTRCQGTNSGFASGGGSGSSDDEVEEVEEGAGGRYGVERRDGRTLSAEPTLSRTLFSVSTNMNGSCERRSVHARVPGVSDQLRDLAVRGNLTG